MENNMHEKCAVILTPILDKKEFRLFIVFKK
jgi:hypothetical protein